MSERIDLAGDSPLATLAGLLLTDPTLVSGTVLDGEESGCGCHPSYMVTRAAYSQPNPTLPVREGVLYGAHMADEFDDAGNIDPHSTPEMRVNRHTPNGAISDRFAIEQGSLRAVSVHDPEQATIAARSILAAYGIES